VGAPDVNVVAETVTCQPGAVPWESSTWNDWSATVESTTFWLRPFTVSVQPTAVGEVRVRAPDVTMSVPVIVQDVPAGSGPAHVAAPAAGAVVKVGTPIPAVTSAQAPKIRTTRLLVVRA
jgi:hypothetical protein